MPANVMSIDLRANTEKARDDVKTTLTEAAKAARDFQKEMYQLREAQLRAREAVTVARSDFHNVQAELVRLTTALKAYNSELRKSEVATIAANAKVERQKQIVAELETAYRNATKRIGASVIDTPKSNRIAAQWVEAQGKLEAYQKEQLKATTTEKYYSTQVRQTTQDINNTKKALGEHGVALRKVTDDSARLATTKSSLSNRIAENRDGLREMNNTLRQHEQAIRDDDRAIRDLTDEGMASAVIGAALMDRALRAVWSTLRSLIVESTIYAGRTVELQVALENVGRVQGYNVGQLRALENAIKSLGITTQDSRQTLLQLAATNLNLPQAPQLARVAQDLAVVAGVDTSEEINRLVAGIETLQIRALRTAGVFVSLEGEMKKASVTSRRSVQSFSEQEKQQILLNAVLDYGARATGTYDQAMTTASKQMRTMNRLTAEMHNAIGSLFQGPFGLAISVMSTFLKLVTAAPGAFVIFSLSIATFITRVSYSTLANASWAQSFRTVAASIIDATRATLGLSAAQSRLVASTTTSTASNVANAASSRASMLTSGTGIGGVGGNNALPTAIAARSVLGLSSSAGTAAATGLSLTGWGLLAAAVGAATYALVKYFTAANQVTFANQENLRTIQRQIQVNHEDAQAFRERADILRKTGHEMLMSDEQRKNASREEAMALMRLDPLQRQAIQNDNSRAGTLDRLANSLDKVNIKLRAQLRDLNRMTVANLDDSQNQIDTLLKRAEQGRQRNTAYNRSSPSAFLNEWFESVAGLVGGSGAYGGDVGSQRVMEDSAKAQGAIETRRNALQGLAEQEREIRLRTNQSTDAILLQEFNVRRGTKAYEEIIAAVITYTREQEKNNGIIRDAQDLHNQMVRNLEQMRVAQFDVTVSTEGMSKQQQNLQAMITGGLALGMSWQTTIGGAQSAIRAYDADLMRTSNSQEEYNNKIASLSPEIQKAIYDTNASAKAFESYGEATGKANKRILELKNNIRDAVREITALRQGVGNLSNLQTVEFAARRELESRRRLQESELERYGESTEQPRTAEEVDEITRRIQGQLDMIKGAREAIFRLERMEIEGTTLQFQVMQQQNDLLNEQTRQRERQMTVTTTFLRLEQDRLNQEKQLTADIAARYRMEAEEAENRRRGIGRDRLAYLQAVDTRQRTQIDLRSGIEALRADVQVRRDLLPNTGGLQIGDFSYLKRFDVIDPTKRDLAVVNLMTAEQKQLHQVVENTFATAENTSVIAESMTGSYRSSTSASYSEKTISSNLTVDDATKASLLAYKLSNWLAATAEYKEFGTKDQNKMFTETIAKFTGDLIKSLSGSLSNIHIPQSSETVIKLRQAIFGQESGYNYRAINPDSGAVGFGQVMPANIPSWTREALGVGLTPTQFRNDPKAQIAVADFQLGKYLREQMGASGGDLNTAIRRVAAAWYGGPGNAGMFANTKPQVYNGRQYPSFNEYTSSVLNKFLGNQDLTIDTEETKQRNEINARIIRGYRLPPTTERNIVGAKGTMDDPDTVISIYTELVDLTAQFNTQVEESNALERERLRLVIESGVKDVDTQKAITDALHARFEEATKTYRDLQAQRYVDASGFQESEENRQRIFMDVELARRKAIAETRDSIIRIQKEIEEVSIGSNERIRLAYLESVKTQARASEDALTSIAQNIPKLEAAAKLNTDVVNASIIDWLAQQRSVSESYADAVTNLMDNTFGEIDKLLERVTGKLGIFGTFISDIFGGQLKASLTQAYAGMFGGSIDKVRDIVGGTPQTVARMDIQTAGQVIINSTGSGAGANLSAAIGNIGLPAPVAQAMQLGIIPTAGQQGSGVFNIGGTGLITNANGTPLGVLPNSIGSGIRGIGMGNGSVTNPTTGTLSALSTIFGTGNVTGNIAGTSNNGNVFNLEPGVMSLLQQQAAGSTIGPATPASRTGVGSILNSFLSAGKGFFGQNLGNNKFGGLFAKGSFGFGNSAFAQMLPLLGVSLGAQLGGQSRLGNIAGGLGGLLLGAGLIAPTGIFAGSAAGGIGAALGGGAAGASGGALGFLAPLFSNPITAIVGGALLIGAVLLGRNSRRRQEEKQRTQILGDAKTRLQQILNAVQRDRMDGASAIAQAQQIKEEYLNSVGQLKDKKTRNIALATVRELDAIINQINTASAAQSRRKELDSLLVPEFAIGGPVGYPQNYAQGRGGVVPGVDMGQDSVLARLRPREVVMNLAQQQRAAAIYGNDFLRNVGVPGFAAGGSPAPITVNNNRNINGKQNVTVILVADDKYAQDLARKTGGTVMQMSAQSLKNKDGALYQEVKNLR